MKTRPTNVLFTTLLFAVSPLGALSTGSAAGEPASESASSENYLLTANDLISIKVFQEDDLTTACRVSADGTVGVPLIGEVKVAGKSTHEAARQIARLLDARFIVNPQVSVSVTSFARRRFTILGQVAKAGAYNMQSQESIDLLEAIGMVGGYTRLANPAKITVKRREGARDVIVQVNGKELAGGGGGKGFRVQAGDTVTVGERLF